MNKLVRGMFNAAIMIFTLVTATLINLFTGGHIGDVVGSSANTKMVFLLAVLIISRYTDGYFWGVLSAVISVPLDNFLFTYPYSAFSLSISGYLLTFATMLTVSIVVSILTSRIRQQEQLRLVAEKEKMRANLLRAVSHDLRTPLTSIVGSTSAILDNALPAEKQQELLQDVNNDAQWLLRMVENLLAITRMSGKETRLNMETEVVEDVLADAVIKFQKHFQQVEVVMDMGDEVMLADMDAVLIEQVVSNLMENAVYHGQRTTCITVRASCDENDVLITVSDNGAGISKEKIPKLFSASLYGESQKTTDSHKHMGIGLSVCKSIIKAHGGKMTAHNNRDGGACFGFTLPKKEINYGSQDSDC